jgi:pantoate--beta-alanine ligase
VKVTRSIAAVRAEVREWRRRKLRVAFVPTMGAIHAGHESLVRRARAQADRVVASVFVNPLQFGPEEDYRAYPRTLAEDRRRLARAGAALLWVPGVETLYPSGHRTRVSVQGLSEVLEGASRPGHFEGVTTVVAQLLNVVRPDWLWLGQKDAQQARIVEQMVADLKMPVKVRRGPTVRESDGLALSSRNAYLTAEQRRQAVALPRGLLAARDLLRNGERSGARLAAAIRWVWREYPLVREDYVAVVDARTLEKVPEARRRVLIAVAARVGKARLIDNFEWGRP